LRFAEWSGGVNINPSDEPAARTDLSFTTVARMMERGVFEAEGLRRVLAVIHPETTFERRLDLNSFRSTPTEEDIQYGRASWQLSETALRIFGHDDFSEYCESYLQSRGIPFVRSIQNDGSDGLRHELELCLPEIFAVWGEERVRREGVSGALGAAWDTLRMKL